MSKYKVGDKVKVRDDLKVGTLYITEAAKDVHTSLTYIDEMEHLKGSYVTIKGVHDVGCSIVYSVREDKDSNYWATEMFEEISESKKSESSKTEVANHCFTKSDLKDGMVVEVRNNWFCPRFMVFGDKLIGPCQYASLNNFIETMEHVDCPNLIIDKVYESNAVVLDEYFKDDNLKLIWERKKEDDTERDENTVYYTGKVICVDNSGDDLYIVGKIYEFKNGTAQAFGHWPLLHYNPARSFEDLQAKSHVKWLEIVE